VKYIPVKNAPATGQCTAGAMVLTSEECAQMIFEHEEKKRKQQQEKEARKAGRELKKKEREEASKRKAEQVAKRKEETARKKNEASAAKKKEEVARKKMEKATGPTTRKVTTRMNVMLSSAAKCQRVNSEGQDVLSNDSQLDPVTGSSHWVSKRSRHGF